MTVDTYLYIYNLILFVARCPIGGDSATSEILHYNCLKIKSLVYNTFLPHMKQAEDISHLHCFQEGCSGDFSGDLAKSCFTCCILIDLADHFIQNNLQCIQVIYFFYQ